MTDFDPVAEAEKTLSTYGDTERQFMELTPRQRGVCGLITLLIRLKVLGATEMDIQAALMTYSMLGVTNEEIRVGKKWLDDLRERKNQQ